MKNILKLICVCLVFILCQSSICFASDDMNSEIELGKLSSKPLLVTIAPGVSSITVQIKDIDNACSMLGLDKTEVMTGKKQIIVADGGNSIAFQVVKIPGIDFTVLQARWISDTINTEEGVGELLVFVQSGENELPSTGQTPNNPVNNVQTNANVGKFKDLSGHWAENDINLLSQKKIVNGDEQGNFRPNDQISRAEFAALLIRALEIEQKTVLKGQFNDVNAEKWYFNVINTAADLGLINGYTTNTFGPDDPITREQIAVMTVRALSYKGYNISTNPSNAGLDAFLDKQQVSSWATEEVVVAVQQGIVKGKSTTSFAPQDNATRAESAVMILRMYNILNK